MYRPQSGIYKIDKFILATPPSSLVLLNTGVYSFIQLKELLFLQVYNNYQSVM